MKGRGFRHFASARVAVASVCAIFLLNNAVAFGDQASVPSADSLISALKAKGPSRSLTTGADSALIKALKEKTSRGIAISSEERDRLAEVAKSLPTYDMEIPFDLDSAEITARARPNIEALGKALQDNQLKGASFLLAGHTDASGTVPYNQALSERRAAAVRKALMSEFHLTDEQLIAVGYGPQHLKNPKEPDAPENRRVQIVNLGE
ncbi:MAG: OmpA family protein [Hyphomicrobium sp.]|uniref:OmpA family protein n=1 Tax=Hyphomicrobium sp. TaxID=82 RepID=UPI0039E5372D